MRNNLLILICLIVWLAGGCALLSNPGGVLALKRYSDNQDQIQRYVDKQEKLFNKLLSNLKDEQLNTGMSKKQFIRTYGEPVLSWQADGPDKGEVLLYRYPTKYFNTDRVYAYFGESNKLTRWEYKPVRE